MSILSMLPLVAYGVSAVAYLAYLTGAGERAARAGRALLAVGVMIHLIDLTVRRSFRLDSTSEALAVIAWLTTAGYLLAGLRHRLAAAGAFVVPSSLVLLVLARITPSSAGREGGISWLGITHIFLAAFSTSVFALAATLAVLYLVQERQLKRREFGRVLGLGSPLETLDRLSLACVSLGFPVFTCTLVTGAVWLARLGLLTKGGQLQIQYVFSVASWIAFGALLIARVGAGWRGRRAAWMAVAGFFGTVLVLGIYVLRRMWS